jgi:hypothetical protein
MSAKGLTEAQASQFLANPSVNPVTKRKIKYGLDTYLRLMQSIQEIRSQTYRPCRQHILIVVIGLGCSSIDPKRIEEIRMSIVNALDIVVDQVILMCNPSYVSAAYDVAQTYCNIRPGLNNAFVKEVAAKVTTHMDAGDNVSLVGFSYGGSVVSRVGELFKKASRFSRQLSIATFGSIYVPTQERVAGIDITHFMYVNDVALKCNGLNHKTPDPKKPVEWLRRKSYVTPVHKEFTFLGTSKEWAVHGSYDNIMIDWVRHAQDVFYRRSKLWHGCVGTAI